MCFSTSNLMISVTSVVAFGGGGEGCSSHSEAGISLCSRLSPPHIPCTVFGKFDMPDLGHFTVSFSLAL